MIGYGFNSEVAQNKTMATSFYSSTTEESVPATQTSAASNTSSEHALGKKVRWSAKD